MLTVQMKILRHLQNTGGRHGGRPSSPDHHRFRRIWRVGLCPDRFLQGVLQAPILLLSRPGRFPWRTGCGRWRAWLAAALLPALSAPAAGELTIRARATGVEPEARVRLFWSWGGRGQTSGDPVEGEWTEVALKAASLPQARMAPDGDGPDLEALFDEPDPADDVLVEHGKASDYHWLRPGVWSPAIPFSSFRNGGLKYLTVTARGCETADLRKPVVLRRVQFEFEILQQSRTLHAFAEASPEGAVCTILLPVRALAAAPGDPAVRARACGLAEYTRRQRIFMEGLPWAADRLPSRYEIITDCGGFGGRTTSRALFDDEFRILRQLGVNGLRGRPGFFPDDVKAGRTESLALARCMIGGLEGYPYQPAPYDRESQRFRPLPWPEGAGCPWHPVYSNRADQARQQVRKALQDAAGLPFETCWLLSIDEIGDAFGGTPEGRNHMGVCPHCIARFRAYLRERGLTPDDFDARDWEPVRPTFGYFAKPYAELEQARLEALERERVKPAVDDVEFLGETTGAETLLAEAARDAENRNRPATAAPLEPAPRGRDATAVDLGDEAAAAVGAEEAAAQALAAAEAERQKLPSSPAPGLSARGWHRLTYWSRRFLNDGSVMLFTPMRDAFATANAAKRAARASGRSDAPEARQPWLFTYALRGNTFLMGGQSIDFFDFYRYSDTGFMYETSNRDPRVWSWDSYLCDVGRMLHDKLGLAFGIYVKPHRGAGTQRALTAVARGARSLYWYTYGPEWCKGDSFGGSTNTLMIVSQAARLIGGAEPVTWEGRPTLPAEIAVVRPRTSEFFGNSAKWEDGKWVYTALQHAHLPVDPLDEEWLMSEDLARYKAIYVTGSHIRRDVARRLVKYVEAGGALFTGCGGLRHDEAGEPIGELLPVFGLASRGEPVLWGRVPRYGATGLGGVASVSNAPPDADVVIGTERPFALKVGYERLTPAPGAEVLATFADGSPALVCNRFGKGRAWLAGWYTGVEYATGVMKVDYNTATDFPPGQRALIARPAVDAGARPVVDTSSPVVEGVRIVNPAGGREAVVLMNWGRKGHNLVTHADLRVRLRDAGAWQGARSVCQRRAVPARREGAELVLDVGNLDNGDVLLLE